ncbi:uncharacterized protein IWZ02DRAFT_179996 [Phyllosticta citriasiana]|uniref:uncharacterized protein n=1 Tax=Phyllosticta citriasiana TaxID=595635 RepID=UPI0030FD3C1D
MPPLEIAIVGCGPVGCMLARLLLLQEQSQIHVTVFEAETSLDFRAQGGTLDLHPKEGIAALEAGHLFDQFVKFARYDGEAIRITDKHLNNFISRPPSTNEGDSRGAPEIDRSDLRRILTESVPADVIRWGWRLLRVELDTPGTGTHRLHFDRGRVLSGYHLIIGADGAWSRVREALAPFSSKEKNGTEVSKPQYVGLAGFRFSIPDAAKTAPGNYKLVNRGSVFSFSDGRGITGQQMGDGSIWVSALGIRSEGWIREQEIKQQQLNGDQHAQDRHHVGAWYKEALLSDYRDWHPELRAFIERGDESASFLPLYSLPEGFSWRSKPGITAIGDAAHLMVPHAGQGVNIGLRDALELSQAILSALATHERQGAAEAAADKLLCETLSRKIAAFESDMFRRSHAAQAASNGMMEAMLFTPGAPRSSIHTYCGWMAKQNLSPRLYPFVLVAVYVYFAVWRLWDGAFGA